MSLTKKIRICFGILVAVLATALFGCDKDVAVEKIYFNFDDEQEQLVLLVGEELDLEEHIAINPSYATNKKYTLTSSNEQVLEVNNSVVSAKAKGNVILTVTSNSNQIKQDAISIVVEDGQINLTSPQNLKYNQATQTLSFDSVLNASGYTLNINDTEYNLGNNTSFALSNLENPFDRVLSVSVKANAPAYSHALVGSGYSSEIKIYQASQIADMKIENGILTFSKAKTEYVTDIYWGTEIIKSNFEGTSLNLDEIDNSFANGQYELSVVEKLSSAISETTCYASQKTSKTIRVLPNIEAELSNTTLSWTTYANIDYEIDFNGTTISNKTGSLDLKDRISSLNPHATPYEIKLTYKYDDNNKIENVIFVDTTTTLKFNILNSTSITIENNIAKWSEVENSSAFVIEVSRDGNKILSTTSQLTQFDLSTLGSGEYNFQITAISNGMKDNVYYISSNKATKTITKYAEASDLKIENYILSFDGTNNVEYQVYLDGEEFKTTTTASLDLSNEEFTAGTHSLSVKALGNQTSSVDANISQSISFVQLEKIENIAINNGVASITLSQINTNAKTSFVVYQGTVAKFVSVGTSYAFNTTDTSITTTYLGAGDYSISVKVEGNGGSTFSYREKSGNDLTVVETANKTFKVLGVPTISAFNKSTAQVTATTDNGTVKFVLDNLAVGTQNGNNCTFDLSAGQSVEFKLQSLGDGSSTLNSKVSDKYTISKLETPVLSFDKTTNIVSYSSVDNASGYVSNKDTYDFASNYDFDEGANVFTIYAEANDNNGTNYFVNSNTASLVVTKLKKGTIFELSKNGVLAITSTETSKHALTLTLNYGGADHVFMSNEDGTTLICGTESLTYDFTNGTYHITLLSNNYGKILSGFGAFSAKVKYTSTADNVINSDESEVSDSFQTLTAENITRSAQNVQFVIDTTELLNDSKEYYVLANGKEYAVYVGGIKNGFVLDEVNQKIELDYETICSLANEEVTTIQIITKKNSYIPSASNEIKTKRADSVSWNYVKDNSITDNSAYISFDLLNVSYAVSYSVKIGELTPALNSANNKLTFKLDDLALEDGAIECTAQVLTIASDDGVEVFNSLVATKGIVKLGAPENIIAKENILTFTEMSDAYGYEIYKLNGSNKDKINSGLLIGNSYEITEGGTYYVRAIAKSDGSVYSNSSISNGIVVQKLGNPELTIENGKMKFTFSETIVNLAKANQSIKLVLKCAENSVDFENVSAKEINLSYDEGNELLLLEIPKSNAEIETFNTDTTSIAILPEYFLNYSGTEKIQLQYVVDGNLEDIYYLNSATVNVENLVGIDAPTNVHINKNSANSGVIDNVSWNWTNNYDGLTASYVMYISGSRDDGAEFTFDTTDARLKYKDASDNLVSYSTLTSVTCQFPACYGIDGDDDYFEFGAGEYEITIRACVEGNSHATNKYCVSEQSAVCNVTIMSAPTLSFENGCANWEHNANATSYELKMTKDTTSYTDTIMVVGNPNTFSYDFATSKLNLNGLVNLQIRAISTNINVLNSEFSENSVIYRIESATDLKIEDGCLILTARPYFSTAKIVFTNVDDGTTREVIYDNLENLQTKSATWITDWTNNGGLTDSNIGTKMNALNSEKFILNDLNLEAGQTYTAKAQLFGGSEIGELSIVNSMQNTSALGSLEITKLKSNANTIEYGKIKFTSNADYHTNLSNITNLNANLKVDSTIVNREFWDNVAIYHITITTGSNNIIDDIYALDYYNFENYKTQLTENTDYYNLSNLGDLKYYVKYGDVYFNVFLDNTINLNYNYLWYYPTAMEISTDNDITWNSNSNYVSIDLNQYSSYLISIEMLGGDQIGTDSFTGYLTASSLNILPFVRYTENTITIKNGKLSILDQKITVGESTDYPVYEISLTNGTAQTIYAYYNGKLSEAKLTTGLENATYLEIEEVQIEDAELGAKTYFLVDIADLLASNSTYSIKIKTLAGGTLNLDSYYINSCEPTIETLVNEWTINDFTIVDGKLQVDMSKTEIDTNQYEYSENYELVLKSGTISYVKRLTRTDVNVRFDDTKHKITYDMPNAFAYDYKIENSVINNNSGTLNISENTTYFLTIRAVDSNQYINSKKSNECSFRKILGLDYFTIENGGLKWGTSSADNEGFCIEISLTDSSNAKRTMIISLNSSDRTYFFGDNSYTDINGNSVSITGETQLNINIYAVKSGCIHSNSLQLTTSRLKKVDGLEIEDGILTWNAVANASSYCVTVGDNSYIVNETQYAMSGVASGIYNVNVRAIGNNIYLNAMNSDSKQIEKLEVVENLRYENGKFVWDAVNNATKYGVVIGNNDEIVVTTNCYTGAFTEMTTIKVRALGSTDQINGEYCDAINVEAITPNPVASLQYNATKRAIVWEMSEFLDADSVMIQYDLKQYTDTGLSNSTESIMQKMFKLNNVLYIETSFDLGDTWENQIAVETTTIGSTEFYIISLTIVGEYSNLHATVLRENTTSSSVVYYTDGQNENVTFTFRPFEYGNGTTDNPYVITTLAQFVNINDYNTNNFKLGDSINLSNINFEDYRENNKIYLIKEFSGQFDGNNKKFYNGNITTEWDINFANVCNFALFGKVYNAEIKNFVFGDLENCYNFIFSFANDISNVVSLSVIAGETQNSTFTNIDVANTKFKMKTTSSKITGQTKIASISANDIGSSFTNCDVTFKCEIDSNLMKSSDSYVASMIASATNSIIDGGTDRSAINFELTQINSGLTLNYVGGVVAKYTADTLHNIKNVSVDMTTSETIKVDYCGGISGFAKNVKIDNCICDCSIKHTINLVLGGVVGNAVNCEITNSTTNITDLSWVFDNASINLGAVCGRLVSTTISYCTMNSYNLETNKNNKTLGIYGSKDDNSSVSNCS